MTALLDPERTRRIALSLRDQLATHPDAPPAEQRDWWLLVTLALETAHRIGRGAHD